MKTTLKDFPYYFKGCGEKIKPSLNSASCFICPRSKVCEWKEKFEAELRKELEENQRFANLETSPEVNRVYHSAKVVLLKAILGEEDPK